LVCAVQLRVNPSTAIANTLIFIYGLTQKGGHLFRYSANEV
jgi:hypothetical protein